MSKSIREQNKAEKTIYERSSSEFQRQNRTNMQRAKKNAEQKAVQKFSEWQRKNEDNDIIISPQSDCLKLIERDKNSCIADFEVDAKAFTGGQAYSVANAHLSSKTVKTGGGITGYSVSETSSGYSVSANRSVGGREIEYTAGSSYSSSAESCVIIAKAVKRGSMAQVLEKEKQFRTELNNDFELFYRTKTYQFNPAKQEHFYHSKAKKTTAYNILFLLAMVISIVTVFLLSLAFQKAKSKCADISLLKLMFNNADISNINGWLFASFMGVLSIITLIMFGIKRSLDIEKDYGRLNVAIGATGLLFISLLGAFLFEYMLSDAETTSFIIVPLIRIILIVLMNTKLIVCIVAPVYFIIGLVLTLINSNIKTEKKINNKLKAFISSGKYEKCFKLEKEIHRFTVSKSKKINKLDEIEEDDDEYGDYSYDKSPTIGIVWNSD